MKIIFFCFRHHSPHSFVRIKNHSENVGSTSSPLSETFAYFAAHPKVKSDPWWLNADVID